MREVFHHWLCAAENYSDAEEFRIAINSCIQAVRNVTFILQKNKKHISGFNKWYEAWQAAMVADPIMKWCVGARNFIVKQGDLETLSIAKVALLNSHDKAKEHIFITNPSFSGIEIARHVKEKYMAEELKKYGYLQVERQWITKGLEEIELLDALAHAFTVLSLLVADIDINIGPKKSYKSRKQKETDFAEAIEFLSDSDKPSCMLAFQEYRTTNYNLGTGETANLSVQVVELDKENLPNIEKRYGDIKSSIGEMGESLEDRVNYHLALAKQILKVDEYLLTKVEIFDSSDKPHGTFTMFRDNEDKYLFWRNIAKRVKKLRAKMIITVGDSWRAKNDKSNPLKLGERIADMQDKEEVVMVCGMARNGEVFTINTPYIREGKSIHFGNDEIVDMKPNFLNPVSNAFRKVKLTP